MDRRYPNEAGWETFDAALRGLEHPEPPLSLRERCLPPAASAPPAVPSAAKGARRILVVDDEPSIRRLIQVQLERAGYEVVVAVDGIEALETFHRLRPDLVVLDVMMPGPDGFRVLQILKDDPRTAAVPVVMLTARSGDDHVRQGWQEGVDFYMSKPFNPAELRTVVDRMVAVLDTPENPPPLRRWLK